MRVKPGASIVGVRWQMWNALLHAEALWREYGYLELVITSGTDAAVGRVPYSLHYRGLGVDIGLPVRRGKLVGVEEVRQRARDLQASLGPSYDVVLELAKNHIHIEYDPRGIIR